ncbi:hypothetical protein AKO1_014467 [Acrasis kona]|uniref:RGS domain-containing protein n=1 Tax=Acrasis kona TaxID=1008807 RepID=A0AAW2YYG1_9EUKA
MFCKTIFKLRQLEDEDATVQCKEIFDKFFVPGEYELNIDGCLKKSIKNALEEKDTKRTRMLFEQVYQIMYNDLKDDCFPRYIRSQMYKDFAHKMGESYIKSLSIHRSQSQNKALLYKPEDFDGNCIDDKDVSFVTKLCEDSLDWKGVGFNIPFASGADPDSKFYLSETNYSIGSENYKLGKIVGHLPCSSYKAMCAATDIDTDQLLSAVSVGYKKYDEHTPYSVQCIETTIEVNKMLTYRRSTSVFTIVYDTERRRYLCIAKTTNNPIIGGYPTEIKKHYPDIKPYETGFQPEKRNAKVVNVSLITAWVFDHISEDRCRFYNVTFVDINRKFHLNNDLIFYNISMRKIKSLRNTINNKTKEEENVFTRLRTCLLNDFIEKYIPTGETQPESSFERRRSGQGVKTW